MAFKYVKRTSPKAAKKPKLGSGKRFKALEGALAKKGARSPAKLAAYIGAKKYGSAKMHKMAAAGRKKTTKA